MFHITNINDPKKFSLTGKHQIIVCDSARGLIVLDLPAASKNVGLVFIIKHVGPGTHGVRITPDGSDLIEGTASVCLTAPLKFIELVANVIDKKGVWHIIGRN